MDGARAYGIGRQAGARGGKIEAPQFNRIHSERTAEVLETHFWQGVRDVQAENRINQED